jgi:hypothetical protein
MASKGWLGRIAPAAAMGTRAHNAKAEPNAVAMAAHVAQIPVARRSQGPKSASARSSRPTNPCIWMRFLVVGETVFI